MRLLQSIQHVDLRTFDWCVRFKYRDPFVRVSRILSITADGPLYVLIGVIFLFLQNWELGKLLALAFLIERVSYKYFKTVFRRNRPPAAIPGFKSEVEPEDQFSFPSGHTSGAFLFASCICFAFPFMIWFMLPWACMVGVARVMLGVHFPTDILAGAIMGCTVCAAVVTVLF